METLKGRGLLRETSICLKRPWIGRDCRFDTRETRKARPSRLTEPSTAESAEPRLILL